MTSAVAGSAALVAAYADSDSTPLALSFVPGPAHHFWIANQADPLSRTNLTPSGHFQLMLKDALDNQLPASSATYAFSYDTARFSVVSGRNDALNLYDMTVSLLKATPGAVNYWDQASVQVGETHTGTSQTTTVKFPYVALVQRDTGVSGRVGLSLYLLDPRPPMETSNRAENFIDLTFPCPNLTASSCTVTNPDPTGDCTVSGSCSGGTLTMHLACQTPKYGVNDMIGIELDTDPAFTGVVECGLDGDVVVPPNNKVNINNEEVKVAVKPKKEVKITVWLHADIIKSGAEAQVQKMKDLYGEFEKLCCPNFNFTVTYKAIPADDWKKIDLNGDNLLEVLPKGGGSKETKALQAQGTAGEVNAFFIPGLSNGWLGGAFGNTTIVVDGTLAEEVNLAHEMGHQMSGNGLDDNVGVDGKALPETNLMWQAGNDTDRKSMTSAQCEKIAAKFP